MSIVIAAAAVCLAAALAAPPMLRMYAPALARRN